METRDTVKEIQKASEKIFRNKQQCTEHWEAAVEEAREQFYYLMVQPDDGNKEPSVIYLQQDIQDFDRETR